MSLSPCLCVRTLLPSLPSLPMEGPVPRKEGTLTYTLLHTTCTTMHDTKLRVCAAAAAAAAAAMTLPFGILSCTVRRERERERDSGSRRRRGKAVSCGRERFTSIGAREGGWN